MLHSLLGRVPSGGEYVTMRDPATDRSMRIEIKHVATANVYYVAVRGSCLAVGWVATCVRSFGLLPGLGSSSVPTGVPWRLGGKCSVP